MDVGQRHDKHLSIYGYQLQAELTVRQLCPASYIGSSLSAAASVLHSSGGKLRNGCHSRPSSIGMAGIWAFRSARCKLSWLLCECAGNNRHRLDLGSSSSSTPQPDKEFCEEGCASLRLPSIGVVAGIRP